MDIKTVLLGIFTLLCIGILGVVGIKISTPEEMGSLFSKKKSKVKDEEVKNVRVWKSYQLGREKEYASNKPRSVGEQNCLIAAQKIYGRNFFTIRPDWLKNPKTGRNLEIDLYNDELGIGIEYDGYQHTVYPNKFHKSEQEFLDQVERDNFKDDVCRKYGIYLIRVNHDCKNIEKEIYMKTPKQWVTKSYKPNF